MAARTFSSRRSGSRNPERRSFGGCKATRVSELRLAFQPDPALPRQWLWIGPPTSDLPWSLRQATTQNPTPRSYVPAHDSSLWVRTPHKRLARQVLHGAERSVSHAISRRQVSLLGPRPAGIVGFAPRRRPIGWLFATVPAPCSALVQVGVRATNRHPIGNVDCTTTCVSTSCSPGQAQEKAHYQRFSCPADRGCVARPQPRRVWGRTI